MLKCIIVHKTWPYNVCINTKKIVAFKPGRNLNSEKYDDSKIQVLGEIESVRHAIEYSLSYSPKQQMQPVTSVDEPDLDDTIRISGSGTVTSIENLPPSFLIHTTQYVDGGHGSDDIIVQGCLDNNPKWADPNERIPQVKAVIGFNGILQHFEPYFPPGKKPITCIVVAVKDIAYIFTPEKKKAKGTENTSDTPTKTTARQKIKARTQTEQTSPCASSQTFSLPSTSQVRLGKRKAEISEDEVNDDI